MANKVIKEQNNVKLVFNEEEEVYKVGYSPTKGRYANKTIVHAFEVKEDALNFFEAISSFKKPSPAVKAKAKTVKVIENITNKQQGKKTMKKATKKSVKKSTKPKAPSTTTKEVKPMKTNDVSSVKESLIEYAKSNLMNEIDSDIRSIFIPQKPTTKIEKKPLFDNNNNPITNPQTGEALVEEVKIEVPPKTKDEIKAEIISKFTTTLEGVIKLAEGFEKI